MVEAARGTRRQDRVLIRHPGRFANLTHLPCCQPQLLHGPIFLPLRQLVERDPCVDSSCAR